MTIDPAPLSDPLPKGATCNHEHMMECCEGCGHFHCPECGLTWDEFAEGSGIEDAVAQDRCPLCGEDDDGCYCRYEAEERDE